MARVKKAGFKKVLVANRGEIAIRVFRTLREMDIASVAIYSKPDENSLHVRSADESRPVESYLDIESIIKAAQGCDAIHPGYGFLSQSASFVEACEKAGIAFIGPSASAMRALGDKRGSRKVAEENGVPVVPGAATCDTVDAAKKAADKVGYPVLIKAAGGGGGKGMRAVHKAAELAEAHAAAKREAKAAFADDRLLVEKLIHPARHVEVQILGDGKNAIALGERECSLQRRFQKIIEESPSVAVDDKLRKKLFDSATKMAKAVGYASAGTVEFLVGPDGSHYFLEVNARLQVEHPVTELLTDMDIVRAQVELAMGGALPESPTPRGHAIEARLNAEDPGNGFLPSAGKLARVIWPQRPGLRIDAGFNEGDEILPLYDSLIGKLIAFGRDREHARKRLVAALKQLVVLGIATNQSYLIDLLEGDAFTKGQTFTTTVESTTWKEPEPTREMLVTAALSAGGGAVASSDSPWKSLGAWRVGS